MLIQDVQQVLTPYGLRTPDLAVLQATNQSYRALLLQPAGPIYADTLRIGPMDLRAAEIRSDQFLELAKQRGDQLVVTPEYYLPEASLRKAALGERFPGSGALWVLGCESMTPQKLAELKAACAGVCEVIFEADPHPAVQGNYFDPVAYCFVAKDTEGNDKRVMLLQFKTIPSRDEHGFENKMMRCGRAVYQFKGPDDLIGLATIICSDAFGLGNNIEANKRLSDRSVLIHIQLNPKPKHVDYRKYRAEVFQRTPGRTDCDIVCLNWAQNIVQHGEPGTGAASWRNESGSAWYLPERRCSSKDAEVFANEAKGLYYTRHEKKRHVLHFHYDEAAFALTVPKVLQDDVAVQDVLVGPSLDTRFRWSAEGNCWVHCTDCPDTGWAETTNAGAGIAAAFGSLQDINNRLSIERAISLSCGPHNIGEHWHRADVLDACRIGDSEVVERTTLQLDRDEAAKQSRQRRIGRVASLVNILNTAVLPLPIKDLAGGGTSISWSAASPNTNVSKPGALPALVAYLGEMPAADTIKNVGDAAFELLRREDKAHRHRVAVCYRTETGEAMFADIKQQRDITYTGAPMTNFTEGY
ncbi:hypothetical protein LMG26686_05511 [Achromobacter mucicolens]|nr:hypothetical protein LMG26686_05511 [Achromobacter mucicolens]